jgi:3-hydroxyisobutyrate dehydrogenase
MIPNNLDITRTLMTTTIGYIGLGNMGGALAARLQVRHPLLVHDRSEAAEQRLADAGAAPCTLAGIGERCDVILLCLPTSDHVRTVLFGDGGLAGLARPGTLIIDQTTGDPAATRAMAADLAQRGVEMIDAPVSGGPRGAVAGTIAIMVGATPAQYSRVEKILHAISPNVFHAGELGAGQVIKLANNLLHHSQRLLSLEVMALAVKNGVEPSKAAEIILAGSGRNYYMEHNMASRVLSGKLASGFTLGLLYKDVRLATQLGADSGVPMLFGNLAKEFYQLCINELDRETQVNAVALVVDRLAGTRIVPAEYSLE